MIGVRDVIEMIRFTTCVCALDEFYYVYYCCVYALYVHCVIVERSFTAAADTTEVTWSRWCITCCVVCTYWSSV